MPAMSSAARFARATASIFVVAGAASWFGPLSAHADQGTIEINNLSFDLGLAKYTAKHLELTGSKLSGPEFKDLLSNLSQALSADGLAKLNADSIFIPDLELDQNVAGMHQLAHYHDVKLTGIRSGKVAAYSIAGGTMSGEMPGSQTMQGTMGSMGGTDIDLPGIARVFSQASSDSSAQKTLLYGTAYASGFEMKLPTVNMSIGKTEMSGIYGRPLKVAFSDLLKQIPKTPDPGKPPSPEDEKAALTFLSSFLDAYNAFSISRMDMHDLKFSAQASPDQASLASFSLADISLTDYADSRIGEMGIKGVDVSAPNGKVHLGRIDLTGFDFHDALDGFMHFSQRLAANPPGAQPSPDDLKLLKAPNLRAISLADFSVDAMTPGDPNDPQAPMTPVKASVAGFEVKPELWADGLPKSVAAKLDHFVFALPANTAAYAPLTAAGLDKIDLSAGCDAQWDELAQRMTISLGRVEYHGLGSVKVTAVAENVPPEAFSTDQFRAQAAWLGAVIKSLDVAVDNHGFLDVVLKSQAAQTGKPLDQLRSDMIAGAAVGLPALLGNSPAAKQLANAVAKFLADPKTLHVSAKSNDGIGAPDMAAPDHILDKVDMTATANQ